jgi:hypothetical protein
MKESTTGYFGVQSVDLTFAASSMPNEREIATGLLPFAFAVDSLKLDSHIPTDDLSAASGLIFGPFLKWKIWRNLKVQPVGLSKPPIKECLVEGQTTAGLEICKKWVYITDPTRTGPAGLSFGKPNANSLWSKVAIRFQWLPIIYKNHPELKVLDNGAEESTLGSLHADPKAVEIYFARQFTPEEANGGGYCSGGGGVNTFIISTEKMVALNIDKTHLAHELGHAIGLSHPGGTNASTGTLMCPSGYARDNPRRNSKENGDNASNPLFTFFLDFSSSVPDCQNSASCGNCFGVCLVGGVEVNC